ncbi:hypothetical protein KAR91_44085 [Candidatus Pacearchaeota archaeon]|nr:hypothetical protein [Candidatus Pacearchaeota archaeon]
MICWLRKIALILFGVSMFLVTVETVSANAPTSRDEISYDNGLLSLSLHNRSLYESLKKISVKTGVLFLFDEKNDSQVSLNIQKMPLGKGVRILLRSYNHAMFYTFDPKGYSRLSKVRIFSPIREFREQFKSKKSNVTNSSVTPNVSKSHVKDASHAMKRNAPWLTESWKSSSINPFAAGARAGLLRQIAEAKEAMEMLRHKGEAENRILNSKIAELEKSLATGDGDQKENLMEIKELEGQKERTEQNNAKLLINEQKNIIGLQSQLTKTKTPDEQKQETVARVNRQTGSSRPLANSSRKQSARKPGGSLAEI